MNFVASKQAHFSLQILTLVNISQHFIALSVSFHLKSIVFFISSRIFYISTVMTSRQSVLHAPLVKEDLVRA